VIAGGRNHPDPQALDPRFPARLYPRLGRLRGPIRRVTGAGAAVFTLRCGPPGGTVPDARLVCARLSAAPQAVLLAPKAYECPGTALSPWRVRISGHRGSWPVHVDMATCWTPQVRLIRLLGISWNRVIHTARAAD
jgi:hypothetical protein